MIITFVDNYTMEKLPPIAAHHAPMSVTLKICDGIGSHLDDYVKNDCHCGAHNSTCFWYKIYVEIVQIFYTFLVQKLRRKFPFF